MRSAATLIAIAGLSAFAWGSQLPVKTYTTADGLADNRVYKIVRDSRGYLWFCTQEGLSRFDGYSFTNYGSQQGLPPRGINDFLETRTGEYWLATNGGLVARVTAAPQRSQIPGYGPFGDDEAQLQEFTVDFGCPPGRILICQAANERTDLGSLFGLPPRDRDRHFQTSRNPARCQPTTVFGCVSCRLRKKTRTAVRKGRRSWNTHLRL